MAVTFGTGKAAILAEIFGTQRDERRLPAQLVRRQGGVWILDAAAAGELAPTLPVDRLDAMPDP